MADGILGVFDCSICKSKYTSPRQLDCFHIFCTPCLEILIEGKSDISCPLCRELIIINEHGIDMFKPYEYHDIQNGEGDAHEIRICQMCDDNEIHSTCIDCDVLMCRNCHEYHLKHKTFRTHKIELLEKSEIKMVDKEVKTCEKHSKKYTVYCKSCNEILCEVCVKEKHQTHKTLPLNSSAESMRHAIGVAIVGLKSKLPHIATFIEHSKAEEQKYLKHVTKTRSDMKISAANLKDLFCKSVDMIFAQNVTVLDCESDKDKKLIQMCIEETEREFKSLSSLVRTSEDLLRSADASDLTKMGSALCCKVRSYEKSLFHSDLSFDVPCYTPGNFSDEPIRKFMGTIERRNKTSVDFHLNLPYNEVSMYPNLRKMTKILSIELHDDYSTIIADKLGHIYLFRSKESGKQQWAELECRNLNGERNSKITTDYEQAGAKPLSVIGIQSEKIFILCSDDIRTSQCQETISKTLHIEIPNISGESACLGNTGDILVLHKDKKVIQELKTDGTNVKTISLVETLTESKLMRHLIIMSTQSNHIFILSSKKIICYDIHGDIKNRFCPEQSSDFRAMCKDRHGNVFVADASQNRICLFTSDGHYIRDILLLQDEIKDPRSLAIDANGNLWVLMRQTISVYSYL